MLAKTFYALDIDIHMPNNTINREFRIKIDRLKDDRKSCFSRLNKLKYVVQLFYFTLPVILAIAVVFFAVF